MTTQPAVYGQFGRALGLAERTLTANLRAHLAERDTEPETWYALQVIATRGPGLAREELVGVLESLYFDAEKVHALLARLEADGLIAGDTELDLTDAGAALHKSLREYIAGPTVELLAQFDVNDIETTVRTLEAVRALAAERLAGSGR
jgi:hypothetical protein